MAVRPIRVLGQPGDDVLRQPAAPVETIDGSLQALIDDMFETVRAAPGVGLAAPQVGVPLKLLVINLSEIPPFALINGEVVRHGGRRWVEEGCLSIPGYRGNLFRSIRLTVRGLDRHGRRIRIRAADDLLAQALEHEIDHTQGLLYVDLLPGPEHLHRERSKKQEPEIAEEPDRVFEDGEAPLLHPPVARFRRHGRPPIVTQPLRKRSPERMPRGR
jgi:peptide deformylase